MLTRQGVPVVGVAKDGQEAVEMAHSLDPEMLLIDIHMPRLAQAIFQDGGPDRILVDDDDLEGRVHQVTQAQAILIAALRWGKVVVQRCGVSACAVAAQSRHSADSARNSPRPRSRSPSRMPAKDTRNW